MSGKDECASAEFCRFMAWTLTISEIAGVYHR